jgi:hypothetical protein
MSAAPFLLSDSFGIRRGSRNDDAAAPYPWVMPPPGAVSVFEHGSFVTPAYGLANQITICQYTVPDGWEGVLSDVMNLLLDPNGNFVEGSGSAFWTIDIDRPLGAALATGRYLPNYYLIPTRLGDLTRPWPVRGTWRMKQGETYRYKFYTVNTVTVGAPAFVHAALMGWVWPMARQGV